MVTFGLVTLWLAFAAAVISIGALLFGHLAGPKAGEGLTNFGYLATFAATGALTISILVMALAFFRHDYTFMYVAQNHSSDVSSLAWLYTLSGVWAGREGSFLLWAWFVSLYASFVAWKRIEITDPLSNMGVLVTNVVLALFTAAMLFSDSNAPFKVTPAESIDPATHQLIGSAAAWGMNPLLQHWAMILHPPMLFIGYAGMTIPFAFAIAALIVNDGTRAWVDIVDRITVFGWLFLGAGIGLGAIWAYVVLGWGGYWGWDPVENASLLPWLTCVGLLHSFTVFKRRDGFKRWAVVLSSSTFALVILGTFITRSGLVDSVHAFEPDPVSQWLFLAMIIVAVLLPLALLIWRWKTFAGNDEFESLTSKEAAYYFNNVIMLVAGWLVAYLTISSGLGKLGLGFLPLAGRSVPSTTFDAVARPVGVAYLAILAICPMLSWRNTDWPSLWKRLRWSLAGAAVIFALLLTEWFVTLRPIYDFMVTQTSDPGKKFAGAGPAWYYHGVAILGMLVASILIANTISLFIEGARKRADARGEGFGVALWSLITKARSQSGGYIAHIGMGVILIGLIGSAMYVQDQTFMVQDKPGTTFQMADYTFTYQGVADATLANGNTTSKMTLAVSRGGNQLGTIMPGMTDFTATQQNRLDAKVYSEPLRDIFVVYQGSSGSTLVVNVKINPLIWFSWVGFMLLLFGTALAVWPKSGARELATVKPRRAKAA
ncbi:MAG: cytochrome c biogenesis protein CcsA [Coriobacteriia bacterium]|nr:cytochrome c biogenesis protein CcsA [Coriobacteriia bacterium]